VRAQLGSDVLYDRAQLVFAVFRGKAYYPHSQVLQDLLPISVADGLLVVHFTVNLDDQALRRAIEIHDEVSDPSLSSEFLAVDLATSKRFPEELFASGLSLPKITCGAEQRPSPRR
jgi:hypothetical protein